MKKNGRLILVLLLLLAITLPMVHAANTTNCTGVVYERKADGGTGAKLAGVQLTFVRTDDSRAYTGTSDNNGRYSINLAPGEYLTRACHRDYEDYSSSPGTLAVGPFNQTANFFLKKPRVTTILLVRHAEKADNSSDPPLTEEGDARAQLLAEYTWKAGISEIYTTDTVRTKATVQYLAKKLKLDAKIYSTPQAVANTIITNHNGDTVLIAGHSDTVSLIANQFGAGVNTEAINDFDNLYVITRKKVGNGPTNTNLINLQYGVPSDPDSNAKGAYPIKTVLLIRHAQFYANTGADQILNPAGAIRAIKLIHLLKKAGIKAIYKTSSNSTAQTVQPLAKALGLVPKNYTAANLQSVLNQETAKVILVAADSSAMIPDIIRKLNGSPLPPVDPQEYDMLYVITLYAKGDAKVTCLQYGAPSGASSP
jgi:broad specificity phosphatase PhoE